jgi:hypothetical protein
MVSAIGFRCYKFTIHKKRNTTELSFDDDELEFAPAPFISNFIQNHVAPVQNEERERSWYFQEKSSSGAGSSAGYVRYGTFGFESDFVNTRTKRKNYRRKVDDVEEIPLFYEFWCPDGADYGLTAFQSFQGRSCIGLVMENISETFEVANPGYSMRFRKLLPNDNSGALYSKAPVKQLRFIKRKASRDITDRYFESSIDAEVDFEVSFSARRRQNIGPLGSISKSLSRDERTGLVLHDGIQFNEAVALIRVGKKYRPVGIFGMSSEAGVIDVTDDIVKGVDGHPTFESLQKQAGAILTDFHGQLSR